MVTVILPDLKIPFEIHPDPKSIVNVLGKTPGVALSTVTVAHG